MRFESKQKVYLAVLITTALSVFLSVVFTGILRGEWSNAATLVPSIIVPLCVAPLASLWGFTQAYKIEELNSQLAELLNHDPLTKVHSRSYFFEIANNDPSPGSAVALMIDADHFKQINDNHGHHIGDLALKHFSEQISQQCRKTDIVARLGGEEFGVYMPDTDLKTAQIVAERIRQEIFKNPLPIPEQEIPLSASIGIASRDSGEQIYDALKRADAALYEAKTQGRNRVRVKLNGTYWINEAPTLAYRMACNETQEL